MHFAFRTTLRRTMEPSSRHMCSSTTRNVGFRTVAFVVHVPWVCLWIHKFSLPSTSGNCCYWVYVSTDDVNGCVCHLYSLAAPRPARSRRNGYSFFERPTSSNDVHATLKKLLDSVKDKLSVESQSPFYKDVLAVADFYKKVAYGGCPLCYGWNQMI